MSAEETGRTVIGGYGAAGGRPWTASCT
jgi:hypothetical protein